MGLSNLDLKGTLTKKSIIRGIFDTFDDKAGFWGVLMTGIVDEHLPVKRMRANPKVFLICLVNGKLL